MTEVIKFRGEEYADAADLAHDLTKLDGYGQPKLYFAERNTDITASEMEELTALAEKHSEVDEKFAEALKMTAWNHGYSTPMHYMPPEHAAIVLDYAKKSPKVEQAIADTMLMEGHNKDLPAHSLEIETLKLVADFSKESDPVRNNLFVASMYPNKQNAFPTDLKGRGRILKQVTKDFVEKNKDGESDGIRNLLEVYISGTKRAQELHTAGMKLIEAQVENDRQLANQEEANKSLLFSIAETLQEQKKTK